MRKFTSFMFALIVCLSANAQKTFFSCDFNNGIPKSFALYDEDGNTPSDEAKRMGFEVGKAWISYRAFENDPTNLSIMSTSSYSLAGTSNDWIVTPAIHIESPNAYFMWKVGNFTKKKDGYKILVSTKGQTLNDFTDAKVLYQSDKGENKELYIYTHIVPLQEYDGQTIYIAAVNNSTDKSFLLMDDFFIGELFQSVDLINTTKNVLNSDKKINIKCSLINNEILSFEHDITVTLNINNDTFTKNIERLKLASGAKQNVIFTGISAPAEGESSNYTITATYTNESAEKIVKSINSALYRIGSVYSRKVVAEEGTGTWCGYCPHGIVGMKAMKEKHLNDFIGIAVHGEDIMQVDKYMEGIITYIDGFPSALVNRSSVIDPLASNLESQYKKEIIKPSIASVRIKKAEFGDKDSTLIRVNVSSSFAFNADRANLNFRYTFVVIENDVKGTSSDYNQTNYYADGAGGRMGGFESLPDPVPASEMSYQEVARFITPFNGIEQSIAQTIEKDKETLYEYTFPTPKNIMHKKNIEVIVLLLDQITGEIWNADKIEAKDMGYNASINGMETTKDVDNTFKAYAIDGNLFISWNTESTTPARVEMFGLDGKKVKDAYFENVLDGLSVPVNNLKGIYVIKVYNGKDVFVKKVIL